MSSTINDLILFLLLSIALPLSASAEVIDFACDVQFEDGGTPTWIFSVDMENGTSDLFDGATVDVNEKHVNIFWKSIDCKVMAADNSKGVCFNNFLIIDRRTLKGPGFLEGRSNTATCRIEQLENQF